MPKIEFDPERQKTLKVPLGTRELQPNTGVYLAEVLKDHGITMVFGVFGGHIWQFVDEISRIGIKNITVNHEQNAVYMAEAYCQVTGKPAVAYGTVGPGAANMVSAVQQAWLSNSPVIILAGGHEIEHDKLYNTIQESYATELMSTITKWAQRVVYPHTAKQFLTRAFKTAQAAPKGPVVLEVGLSCLLLPPEAGQQSWLGVWGEHASWIPQWRGADTTKPLSSGGDPDDIAKAVKRLYEVDKPFLIIGDGPNWDHAGPELEELINLAKIPFTTRRLGRGVISETHPYCTRGLPPFAKEIELMIPVGVKVGFFDGFGGGWPETIQIATCEQQVWTYLKTSVAMVGNSRAIARQMIDYIKAHNLQPPPGREAWIKKVQQSTTDAKKRRREKAMRYKDHPRYQENNIMHHGYLSQVIADYLEKNYANKVRVVIDGYTISDFIMPFLTATRPAQILTASEQAGVGHGIGMAIGAAFADMEAGDNTPILSLMGDAGMGNTATEIEIACKYKLPIVFLVTNNDGWLSGMKYAWYGPNYEMYGEQDQMGAEWYGRKQYGTEREAGTRWDQVCAPFGAYGETVARHEDFPAALDRAFKEAAKGHPAVLNCMVDKHLANRAIIGPVYCLTTLHLPYEEIAKRGKAHRRTFWASNPLKPFENLKHEPEMKLYDYWEPFTDEEMKP